jgi:DNA primase
MTKVDQIKAALPLAPFVAPYTGGLKKSGQGWYIGRCPFHQPPDDPPNKRRFWVNPDKGICGCFVPRCQAGRPPMDVINFYARLQNISNGRAVEELAKRIDKTLEGGKGQTL